MKFYLFVIELLRKISKSFIKKEKALSRLKIYSKWKQRKDINNIVWNESIENSNSQNEEKIAICVVFL